MLVAAATRADPNRELTGRARGVRWWAESGANNRHMPHRYTAAQIADVLGLPRPTGQQAAIIEAPLTPNLVIAGAGSGKTETMAARVIWLVANELVKPEQVLGLTFTRKAAGELSVRIRGRLAMLRQRGLADVAGEPMVSTYHAYAIGVVAEHGVRAGLEPTSRLITEAVSWQHADAVVQAYDGDMSAVDAAPSTVTAAVLELFGQLAEHLRTPAELADWTDQLCRRVEAMPYGERKRATPAPVKALLERQRARAQLLPLVQRYSGRKQRMESMDFADQIARAAAVARDHPEVGAVERARYRVVLLDEYQDTSHAQLVLLRSLFGDGHPVTAVGDPCQSIYGWRGASAGNLTRFPRDFPSRRGITPIAPLSVSWRNAPRILGLANKISAPLRSIAGRETPELVSRPGIEHHVGELECALHSTVDDEAQWLAERISALWTNEPNPPTTAVLVRRRGQCDRVAAALRAVGVPVEVVGLGGLLSTPEIRDVVATLTVLSDPTAGNALLRLLTGARWRVGPRDLAALMGRAKALVRRVENADPVQGSSPVVHSETPLDHPSIVEALDDLGPAKHYSPRGYARLSLLRDELRALRTRVGDPLPELVSAVERALCLDIEVAVRRPDDPALARAHLDAFADAAAKFADTAETATLSAFLAYLGAAESEEYGLPAGQVEVHQGAVQLLTVHAAKGLEWDVVAVPGLSRGVFPSEGKTGPLWTSALGVLPFALRGDRDDLPELNLAGVVDQAGVASALEEFREAWALHQLTEERRLAYVAVTRARHRLLCSGYWWDEATKPRGASVFLEEAREYSQGDTPIWTQEPEVDAANPMTTVATSLSWPSDPLAERREAVVAGAHLVSTAMRFERSPAPDGYEERQWHAEAELLLAERAETHIGDTIDVPIPPHLSVSQLVTLQRDPERLAHEIRRPMPRPPSPWSRRGMAFHAWLEQRFGSQQLFDLDELLPGSADDVAESAEGAVVMDAEPADNLLELQQAFCASAWADRTPIHAEVPFATTIAGVAVHGRMDAVFADADGGFDVIDWKTGAVPAGEAARAAAVQLAAYRFAWADIAGVPLERVRAGFHYVRPNKTVRPSDILGADELAALVSSRLAR